MSRPDQQQPNPVPNPKPNGVQAQPAPPPNPMAVLAKLLHKAKERDSRYLEHQVERIAAEVLFFEEPPPPAGSVEILLALSQRLNSQQAGRRTATYDNGSGTAVSQSDSKTQAISKRVDIEERIRKAFRRPALRRFLVEAGYPELASAPLSCRACESPLAADIASMLDAGEGVETVAHWTAEQGRPISKSTLSRHRSTCLRRMQVASLDGLEQRMRELQRSARQQLREAGRLRTIIERRKTVPADQQADECSASDSTTATTASNPLPTSDTGNLFGSTTPSAN